MATSTLDQTPAQAPSWTIAGNLLDALTRRDFRAFADCLATDVRFRALVPPGPFSFDTAAETAAKFEAWFGGPDDFEVVDATVGQIGSRIALRWRVRMCPAAYPAAARVVEQHVYATGRDRIEALDLLCSGFHAEQAAPAAPSCPLP